VRARAVHVGRDPQAAEVVGVVRRGDAPDLHLLQAGNGPEATGDCP
jgi:hypothetical protein